MPFDAYVERVLVIFHKTRNSIHVGRMFLYVFFIIKIRVKNTSTEKKLCNIYKYKRNFCTLSIYTT